MPKLQTANATVAIAGNIGQTVRKYAITAAEVAVLQVIHGDDAVTDIQILPGRVERSNRDELSRLREIYKKQQPSGKIEAPAVDQLFPGAAARVFETFDEMGLPDDRFRTPPSQRDPLDHDGDGVKGGSRLPADVRENFTAPTEGGPVEDDDFGTIDDEFAAADDTQPAGDGEPTGGVDDGGLFD